MVKQKPKESVLTGVAKKEYVPTAVFDNFFRLRIRYIFMCDAPFICSVAIVVLCRNPKISSTTFDCYIDGHRRVRMSELRLNTSATAGVIVNRDVRKSVNGKDYLIWKLHDLKDCQDPPVTLLLFGEACKEFWKLQVGICVALMTPQIADNDQNICTCVLTEVFKYIQVVELGFSSDLGTCKGVKLDGQKCSNFVNISLSEFCVHHVMKEARKLSANRAQVLSTTSNLTGTIHPVGKSNVFKQSEMKTTTKAEERTKLKEIIGGRVSDRILWVESSNILTLRNMIFMTRFCSDTFLKCFQAQGLAMQKHLDSLEQAEKVETFASECMAVKNVRVVSCKKCGYTAQKQSELCMREGHYVTKGTAEKRFFKCSSCQRRTVAYGIMPTKVCKHCHENEWVRVAMKDERKVQLENEKLLVRGEERKFVNS
uniref:Protein MCM10 homolog n=1 Tax=Angiostrongylus cantonensis TaxID=6313 RepID=A0A0K0DNB4_ANGCA